MRDGSNRRDRSVSVGGSVRRALVRPARHTCQVKRVRLAKIYGFASIQYKLKIEKILKRFIPNLDL